MHDVNGRYELSPLAAGLLPQVREVVHGLSNVFSANAHFDPGADTHDFSLCMSDYVASVLGPILTSTLADDAPHCTLRLLPIPRSNGAELRETLRHVDAVIVPSRVEPPGETLELFHDTWCCVVDATRADEVAGWPMARFAEQSWVATDIDGVVPASEWLRTAGFEARIAMTTPTFTSVPYLVSGTSLLGLAQRRLAERLADATGTAAVPLPGPGLEFELELELELELEMVAFHDETRRRHPATRWLLGRLTEAARRVAADATGGRTGA